MFHICLACLIFQGLAGLKRLECLRLAWNKGVTDEVVEKVCGSMSGLKELDLSLCGKITSRSLQVWYGMVWYGMVWYGRAWHGMVGHGMVWYGMVWYGMVWYGMV